jgi:hypothetical protein
LLDAFTEIMAVYSENRMKPINPLCEQNAELLNTKSGGSYPWFEGAKGLYRVSRAPNSF